MENIFDKKTSLQLIERIQLLKPNTKPKWGKMTVDQMLAHCNVPYEYVFENNHKKPSGLRKWFLKIFVKPTVVSEIPYPKNGRTAPDFLVSGKKDFEKEKARLIAFINKTQVLGETFFDKKESHSFGQLTKTEWNNMFYKHLDHHLIQFNV